MTAPASGDRDGLPPGRDSASDLGRRQLLAAATRGALEVSLAAGVLPQSRVASLLGIHPGTLRRDAAAAELRVGSPSPPDALSDAALLADLQAISDEYRLDLGVGITAARRSPLVHLPESDRRRVDRLPVANDVVRKRRERAKNRTVNLVVASRGRVRPTDDVSLPLLGSGEWPTGEVVERLGREAASRYERHDPTLERELYAAVTAISRSALTVDADTELSLLVALAWCWRDADDLRVRLLVRRLARLAPADDPRCEAIELAAAGPTRAHGYISDAVRIWSSVAERPHRRDTQPVVDALANLALALAQFPADRETPERMLRSTRATELAGKALDGSSEPERWQALIHRRRLEALLLHAAVDRYMTPSRRPVRRPVPLTSKALWEECTHQHDRLPPASPWRIGWGLTQAACHLLELDAIAFREAMDGVAGLLRRHPEFSNQLSEYRVLARLAAGEAPFQPELVRPDEIDPIDADDRWLWHPAAATTPNGPCVRHGLGWTLHETLSGRAPS